MFLPENRISHFMQIRQFAWNAKSYFLEKKKKQKN